MPAKTVTPAPLDLAALPADALLTETETAGAIRIAKNTLANWRSLTRHHKRQQGPKFIRLAGSMIRYRVGDVRAFIAGDSGEDEAA